MFLIPFEPTSKTGREYAILEEAGVITDGNADKFIECIANHRFWNREEFRKVPA